MKGAKAMLTDERIRDIRERCEAATPGPWRAVWKGNTIKSHRVYADGPEVRNIACGISPKTENAEFIANARKDIPALLDELDRLRAEADKWRGRYDATYRIAEDGVKEQARLRMELETIERERDAMAHDLTKYGTCDTCKHYMQIEPGRSRYTSLDCDDCMECDDGEHWAWEWRGPVAENTPAPEMGAPGDDAMGGGGNG